jgi:uncharacterized membrane protein YcaP (DUF421 family)
MDPVLRGFVICFAVWLLLRLSGRETLAELTTFEFILIIAEATQQALRDDDFSIAWYRLMLGAATSYLLSASMEEQLEQMTV